MTISNADIQDWEANPVTKAIHKKLARAAIDSMDQIAIQETCDETAMRTAESIGFSGGCLAWKDAVDELKGESE